MAAGAPGTAGVPAVPEPSRDQLSPGPHSMFSDVPSADFEIVPVFNTPSAPVNSMTLPRSVPVPVVPSDKVYVTVAFGAVALLTVA